MPPLKSYTVDHDAQEVLDRVAEAIRSRNKMKLKLIPCDGRKREREVTFMIQNVGTDTLSTLIIGLTEEFEEINITLPTEDIPTALLRT